MNHSRIKLSLSSHRCLRINHKSSRLISEENLWSRDKIKTMSLPLYSTCFTIASVIQFSLRMAKKGARELVMLVCSLCKNRNYISERNKVNMEEKLVVNKYCKNCRKRTSHKEETKLK